MLITLKGSPVLPLVSAILCPQVTHTDACKLFGQEMDGEIMSNDRAPVAQKQTTGPGHAGTTLLMVRFQTGSYNHTAMLLKKKN